MTEFICCYEKQQGRRWPQPKAVNTSRAQSQRQALDRGRTSKLWVSLWNITSLSPGGAGLLKEIQESPGPAGVRWGHIRSHVAEPQAVALHSHTKSKKFIFLECGGGEKPDKRFYVQRDFIHRSCLRLAALVQPLPGEVLLTFCLRRSLTSPNCTR